MAELMTQSGYARHRGVSQPAVNKAIKAGRIKTINGKIDPEQADKDWASNTNAGQKMRKGAVAGGAPVDEGGAPPGNNGPRPRQEVPAGGSSTGESGVNYAQARAIHEGYRARMAKIEFDVKTGKLVDADKVRVNWFNLTRRARDMILSLPDRLSPVLAGEINQFEVHRILLEELRRVCDDISRGTASA